MKIGAQLFTLRDYCKIPEDFAETLKKVADIGYTIGDFDGSKLITAIKCIIADRFNTLLQIQTRPPEGRPCWFRKC